MTLKIHNTLSGQKEVFKPIEENKIKMYVCGMTVYDYCHIGHARVMVGFDVITRFLRHAGYDVTYIRNITDVDDKIFARAAENGENYARWCNDKFEKIITSARQITDQSKRDELYQQAQIIFYKEQPWINVSHPLFFIAMRDNIEGFVMSPLGKNNFATTTVK